MLAPPRCEAASRIKPPCPARAKSWGLSLLALRRMSALDTSGFHSSWLGLVCRMRTLRPQCSPGERQPPHKLGVHDDREVQACFRRHPLGLQRSTREAGGPEFPSRISRMHPWSCSPTSITTYKFHYAVGDRHPPVLLLPSDFRLLRYPSGCMVKGSKMTSVTA